MKALLDHNVSEHLKALLPEHVVLAAKDRHRDGWDTLRNGALLRAAEAEQFEVFVTGDKGIYYQQNNRTRLIALVVISTTKWEMVRSGAESISSAISRATPGSFEYVILGSESSEHELKR